MKDQLVAFQKVVARNHAHLLTRIIWGLVSSSSHSVLKFYIPMRYRINPNPPTQFSDSK